MFHARALGGTLAILLAMHSLVFAQGTADIVGRVTDTSGGVLPAVTVTAENIATKNVRTTVSSDTGDYVFTLLAIGVYTVRIELQGFQTVNSRVELATGDRARVDARLQLGTVAENVIVTGESPLLQTDSSTVSSLINEKTVQDAPIPGRNIIRMVQLIPGASEGALSSLANGTRPDERRQTSSVSINGVNDVLNNQLVDGMDNNERTIGTVAINVPGGFGYTIDATTSGNTTTGYFYREVAFSAYARQLRFHPNFTSTNKSTFTVVREGITSPKPFALLFNPTGGSTDNMALRASLEFHDRNYTARRFQNGTATSPDGDSSADCPDARLRDGLDLRTPR